MRVSQEIITSFARVLIVAAAYALLSVVGLKLVVLPDGSSLLWLPAGVALGLTYWWGYRDGLLGAALGMGVFVGLYRGMWDLAALSAPPVVLGVAIGVALLRRAGVNPRFREWRDVALFALIGVVANLPSPVLNSWLRDYYGLFATQSWLLTAFYRWMGDWLGYLLVGGFLLVWWGNWQMRKRDYFGLALLTGSVVIAAWAAFQLQRTAEMAAPALTLLLPPMIVATFAYQQRGAAIATLTAGLAIAVFVPQWHETQPLTFKYGAFGWLFLTLAFATLMTVASPIAQQREYARHLEESRQELERAYQQVREVLENAPTVAMQMFDAQGRVLFWNRASEQFYGYTADQAIGKTLDALILTPEQQREFMEMLQQVARTGKPAPLHEWRVRTADGKERVLLSSLFPIRYANATCFVCADIDITERKALEQRLFHAEKLESVGRLAGGVAHDFNNLLTAILGFAELAQARLPEDHPAQSDLQRIVEASERAANLVRQLLGFARKQLTQPRPVAVNEVVANLTPLLERTLGENIQLVLHLTPEETTVLIDPSQLEQIVMNLTLNARDAMRSKGRGTITITTQRRVFATDDQLPPIPEGEPLASGAYICLTVQDTGMGIPEELRHRIFEPFFSTKGYGNTGLGLATVYGIVRQNKGFVTFESELGVGTAFHVCLPAWEASDEA
ncbi:MAG: PAS domain S-box protein [Fimbriimonadales bacterium]|nr:PAS domain S-box protein [Fimbriimonadales bacterium]